MRIFNLANPIFRIWHTLVFLVIVALPLVANSTLIKWDTEIGGNKHLYDLIIVNIPLSWNHARSAIQAIGSNWDLVTITSSVKNNFVKGLFDSAPCFFNTVASGTNRSGPWVGEYNVLGSTFLF